MGKLLELSSKCENNEEVKKKIVQLSVLDNIPDNVATGLYDWSTNKNSDYSSSLWDYTSKIFTVLVPRYFHSINKLLNYFEFHNLGSLFIFIFKRIQDDGLFKITGVEGSTKNKILNRLKYASSIHKFISQGKFDGIETIRLALIYGYIQYDLSISKIDNMDAMDKFYLKMMSIIVSNLKIKNHLIDILKRLYLNNTFIKDYNKDQKEVWYKNYFLDKRVIMRKKLNINHKTYDKLISDKSEKNSNNILKVNALISMSDAFSIMLDPIEHLAFFQQTKIVKY